MDNVFKTVYLYLSFMCSIFDAFFLSIKLARALKIRNDTYF